MIEVLVEDRCIDCNICVKVCPTNVFEKSEHGHPIIARVEDCQTCFMCEVYCPVDALYVAPEAYGTTGITEKEVKEGGFLGSYRKKAFTKS